MLCLPCNDLTIKNSASERVPRLTFTQLLRFQHEVKGCSLFPFFRVVLGYQAFKSLRINQDMNMRRSSSIRGRRAGLQTITTGMIGKERCPVGIIIGTVRSDLPDFNPDVVQRTAITSRSNRSAQNITLSYAGAFRSVRAVKRADFIPRGRCTGHCAGVFAGGE